MIGVEDSGSSRLRWHVYWLLIVLAIGNMTGRLFSVNSVNLIDLEKHVLQRELRKVEAKLKQEGFTEEEHKLKLKEAREEIYEERKLQRPFLSANDRSRWLAIRALVELGSYEIEDLLDRRIWNTIDMVQHRGRDGELHLYSSKPPLLITLLAAEYWVIYKTTGMTLESHPYVLGRVMLVTVNILPMAVMFWLLAKMAERFGTTDWGRLFMMACATQATMLNTFAVVLNNHLIAAVSATIALSAFLRIWCDGESRVSLFAISGLAGAFTASNELPALAFLTALAIALFVCNRRMWLISFLPAVILVVAAFFGTNYAAHDCWTPPYMHKGSENPEEDWYDYSYTVEGVTRESYWRNRQGIDRGEPSKLTYAFHVLNGHHGIFSLTPVWLLSVLGLLFWCSTGEPRMRWVALGILGLTLVCLVFYVGLRPQEDRNYGGTTSGFRWMFWFAPFWLVGMLPALDRLSSSLPGRALSLVLLIFSVLSVNYPTWNPWIQPWIYRWMEYCGWQGF